MSMQNLCRKQTHRFKHSSDYRETNVASLTAMAVPNNLISVIILILIPLERCVCLDNGHDANDVPQRNDVTYPQTMLSVPKHQFTHFAQLFKNLPRALPSVNQIDTATSRRQQRQSTGYTDHSTNDVSRIERHVDASRQRTPAASRAQRIPGMFGNFFQAIQSLDKASIASNQNTRRYQKVVNSRSHLQRGARKYTPDDKQLHLAFRRMAERINAADTGRGSVTHADSTRLRATVDGKRGNPQLFDAHVDAGEVKNARQEKPYFRILPLTRYYERQTWLASGSGLFSQCSYSNCRIVNNHALVNACDAVLVHIPSVRMITSLERAQSAPWQTWIAVNRQAPPITGWAANQFTDVFNATMTYARDATIPFPYGRVVNQERVTVTSSATSDNFVLKKTKQIAWFASNCNTISKRELYVNELRKYAPVDIYGKCGTLECPRHSASSHADGRHPCHEMLHVHYKFYLSFENSLCRDYVTEKLFRILTLNVVPIVLGGADYSRLLPPNSYIDVRQFPSAKDLAKYLRFLDKHNSLYLKYFEWKAHFKVDVWDETDFACPLCQYLNLNKNVSSTVSARQVVPNPSKECYQSDVFLAGVL